MSSSDNNLAVPAHIKRLLKTDEDWRRYWQGVRAAERDAGMRRAIELIDAARKQKMQPVRELAVKRRKAQSKKPAIIREWEKLSDQPEHSRAARVAKVCKVTARYVRRVIRELNSR